MGIDSRNPVVYYSGLVVVDGYGNRFALSKLDGRVVSAYNINLIESTMYIDSLDLAYSDEQYVKRNDYNNLKAKLKNLERKHAKLRRRHDTLGQKYVILNQRFEGLLYRVKIMEET